MTRKTEVWLGGALILAAIAIGAIAPSPAPWWAYMCMLLPVSAGSSLLLNKPKRVKVTVGTGFIVITGAMVRKEQAERIGRAIERELNEGTK